MLAVYGDRPLRLIVRPLGRLPRLYLVAAFGALVEIPATLLAAALAGGVLVVAAAALARRLSGRGS